MARWERIESCFDARGSLQVGLCYHKGHTGRRFLEYAHLEAPADNQRHFKRSGTPIDVNPDAIGLTGSVSSTSLRFPLNGRTVT